MVEEGNTVTKKAKHVQEQRVTQLVIHVLIGLSALAAPVLTKLPQAVLYGVFLFMGVSTISGNALFDRMFLWLIWDSSKNPAYKFTKSMPMRTVHLYTFIQFLCLVILYALKSIKAVAVVFPFFLVVIAIVRIFLQKFGVFTYEQLVDLDGLPAKTPEIPPEADGVQKDEDKEGE